MSTASYTVIRREEQAVVARWEVEASSMLEVQNAMEHQLSSPPTSYEFECNPPHIHFQHRQTYPERLKVRVPPVSLTIFPDVPELQSSKARIEALEAAIEALKAAEASRASADASRAEISLDWEARTRIALGALFPIMYLSDHLMTDQHTRAPLCLSSSYPKACVFPPQNRRPRVSYVYHFWDTKMSDFVSNSAAPFIGVVHVPSSNSQ